MIKKPMTIPDKTINVKLLLASGYLSSPIFLAIMALPPVPSINATANISA
ncbi:hypothetical protein BN2127_JRS7_03959 [Bacillus subtilis]|nr:hypothetical protein BN2127_JRS1_09494 [Bacillus cereus]CUB45477.1 hypothetical protein BN2127_JRS7_03959 [Bacillus subtilis]